MSPQYKALMDEFYPAAPVQDAPEPPRLRTEKRARQIRLAMRRLRARRRQSNLNNAGRPMDPAKLKFVNKKYRKRYAKNT